MEKTSPDSQTMMMNETSGHYGDYKPERPASLQDLDHTNDEADYNADSMTDDNSISDMNEDMIVADAVEPAVTEAIKAQPVEPQFELENHSFVENNHEELSMLSGIEPDKNIEPIIEPGAELMDSLGAIPDKMAFKIGEAAEMVGVKQYVLRYWETEFEQLRPRKSKNGQRVYSRRDVESAMMIKKLLYDDRFSIEGARAALKQLKTHVKEEKGVRKMAQSQETAVSKLRGLASEIRRIREMF